MEEGELKKPSKEFLERKELIRLQRESDKEKFEQKIKVLEFERETERRKHEWEMERFRIRNAEYNKTLTRKEQFRGNRY